MVKIKVKIIYSNPLVILILFVGITSWYRNSGNKINKERNIINTLSSAIEWATSGNKFLNYHLT